MDTTMCRIDEQDFPIDSRQLTLEEWQNFKRRVTKRAQQDR
jgi:L-asparaginase/Glu-tRNA(Gln) amidotransferase subunit D